MTANNFNWLYYFEFFLRSLPTTNDTTATNIIVPINAGKMAMPPKCQPQSPSSQLPRAEPTIPAIILPKIPPGISLPTMPPAIPTD
ncbi:Uncharacterised protein [Staphylococcus gallinarum]|uniref:Uncharacterized protein n=1 Tax=Staphylococcus gallinarum TaxID=1293 RepID=A0A380FFB3_STAGA|nr:Uncharacterised protein [Staphylococcus gallinarum]